MKTLIIFLFLSGVVVGQVDTSGHRKVDSNILFTKPLEPATRLVFNEAFSISWKNKIIEIIYDKDATPTESIKKFFEWLKQYMEEEYYIIKRKDLDKVLSREIK